MSVTNDHLKNVFWLGGSPCAGKSSISEIIRTRFDLDVYHVDEGLEKRAADLNSTQQPNLSKWLASSWDERWMQPVDRLLEEAKACYREHFDLVRQDIMARSQSRSVLVEGTALLPREVVRVLSQKSNAIWIIPTASFQREYYSKREWARGIVRRCNDPEAAFHNWMERDIRFAEWIETEVRALDLKLLKIDASKTIDENAREVARHFQLSAD